MLTRALVVMLKESDLLSHTVIEAETFGCFCQQMTHSDWAGLCSDRIGGGGHCLVHEVKGEVLSRKYSARDRKGRGLPHGGLGNQCNGSEEELYRFFKYVFLV